MLTATGPARILNALDRCDRCGAQAFVVCQLTEGELMFCGHHFAKYQDNLIKVAFDIQDERDQINLKSESSA